ncbi:MAG: SDR family oxidoreductase [Cyanobacteriota bacterium]
MNRIALVTGTSSGVGLSTAVLLAQSGFTVVATMRNLEKRNPLETRAKTENVTLDVRRLDVQDAASIDECVNSVVRDYGQIDVLVNNAGAGYLGTLEQTSIDDLNQTMDVNFFGVWRVTQAVLPLMRSAGSGRIITVTSVGGLIGHPFNDAYCAAKFAVEGFMESLAPVVKRLGISVSLIEPGAINTEFVASVLETRANLQQPVPEAYSKMLDAYLAATEQVFATIGQTGDDIAKVIAEAATADVPHFRYQTSDLIRGLVSSKYVDPTGDAVVAMSGDRLP